MCSADVVGLVRTMHSPAVVQREGATVVPREVLRTILIRPANFWPSIQDAARVCVLGSPLPVMSEEEEARFSLTPPLLTGHVTVLQCSFQY